MTATTKTPANPGGHDSLAAALVAFQADMPKVAKGSLAQIPGKNGGAGYSYRYASLPDTADVVHPALAAQGLSFSVQPQPAAAGGYDAVGVLRHVSGQEDRAALPLHGRTAQEIGSSLTYMRRYLLGVMTGVVTDDDEDGTIATANAERLAAQRPPTPGELLVEELNALNAETGAQVRAAWPAGFGPANTLSTAQADQVRALVDAILTPAEPQPAAQDPS